MMTTRLLVFCMLVTALVAASQEEETIACPSGQPVAQQQRSESERALEIQASAAKLRNLLNWNNYKAFFHKEYGSTIETMHRMKVFIANSLVSVKKLMQYLKGTSSYYLTLNRFSDQTHDELLRRYTVQPDEELISQVRKTRETNEIKEAIEASEAKEADEVMTEGQPNGFVRMMASVFCPKGDKKSNNKLAMLLDWRPRCLQPPQDQGDCNSCYAMASLKLLEWHHCRQKKSSIKFSEQLLVDCGRPFGLAGCQSGSLANTVRFVLEHGMTPSEHWPYMGREQQCPMKGAGLLSEGDLLRPLEFGLRRIERASWQQRLQEHPLIVNLAVPEHFFDYAGGVFEGTQCDIKRSHFMVLVGHGIQEGRPFWLLANSFGPDYGVEGGYFRMSRRRDTCLAYAIETSLQFR